MKKALALFLSTALIASVLTACSSKPANSDVSSSGTGTSAAASDIDSAEPSYTIKLAIANSLIDPEEPETIFCNEFSSKLAELTDGEIAVEVYQNQQLGTMEEMRDMCISGTLEACLTNINTISSVYSNTMALACPGLFADEAEVNAVLRSEWGKNFFSEMAEATGLYTAAVCANGMRCYTSSKSPLTTVDSIQGQTIRVMQDPLSVVMAESIGINAVPMAGSEMYSAMQSGTVDGQENGINSIINDKTYEVQKYLVLDRHMPSILLLEMSYEFYQILPEEYRTAVDEAALYASEAMEVAIDRVNVEGIEYLKEQGIEVYEPTDEEREAWQSPAYEACSEYLKEEIGSEILDSLSAEIANYRGQ